MKKRILSAVVVTILGTAVYAGSFTLAPDGSYVGGSSSTLTPNGSYAGD